MIKFSRTAGLCFLLLAIIQVSSFAEGPAFNADPDYAQVVSVRMVYRSDESWDIHVEVFHNDEGWDHYANIWQVVDAGDGSVLGERILAHPHDTEQPFVRSLSGVRISSATRNILVRSRCNLHDSGGKEIRVELPQNPEASQVLNLTE